MGSSETGEVATASAAMAGIKDLFSFSVCEATTKDRINPATIEVVTNKKVSGGLVSDTSTSLTVKVEGELLGSQISKNIAIPRVIGSNGKQVFIREIVINGRVLRSGR